LPAEGNSYDFDPTTSPKKSGMTRSIIRTTAAFIAVAKLD